jgi:hypothetical protein
VFPGWLLEAAGNCGPRGMAITRFCRVTAGGNRTRLIACFGQNIKTVTCDQRTNHKAIAQASGEAVKGTSRLGDDLDDQELWDSAIAAVKKEFAALPELFIANIRTSTETIKKYKKAIFVLTEMVGGGKICENCRGECCKKGKYHFTVIDLLVFLAEGKALFAPHFGRERCPYSGDAGCLMEPEYRPFNCITFHCERLEELLQAPDIEAFYELEKKLRSQYSGLERMFDNRLAYGLLSNYEQNFTQNGIILFKKVPGG